MDKKLRAIDKRLDVLIYGDKSAGPSLNAFGLSHLCKNYRSINHARHKHLRSKKSIENSKITFEVYDQGEAADFGILIQYENKYNIYFDIVNIGIALVKSFRCAPMGRMGGGLRNARGPYC